MAASAVALPMEEAVLYHPEPRNSMSSSELDLGSTPNPDFLSAVQPRSRHRWRCAGRRQTAISQVQRQLPLEMPAPPSFSKVNPADQPILFLALGSDTLPLSQVDEYAETLVAQNVSMINGVAQVQVNGGQKYAVHVQLDPQALAAKQVDISEVEQSLDEGNVNMPTGSLWGRQRSNSTRVFGNWNNYTRPPIMHL